MMTDHDTVLALIVIFAIIAAAVPVGLMPRTKLGVVKWSFIAGALLIVSGIIYDLLVYHKFVINDDVGIGLLASLGLLLLFSLSLRIIADIIAKHRAVLPPDLGLYQPENRGARPR
jgi:hypothetical protein